MQAGQEITFIRIYIDRIVTDRMKEDEPGVVLVVFITRLYSESLALLQINLL